MDDDFLDTLQNLIDDGDPCLQDVLVEACDHREWRVRVFAALRLAELFQDMRALPGLAEALRYGDRNTQKAAAEALWELGDADSAGLFRALHMERGEVRDLIAEALLRIGWIPDSIECEVALHLVMRNWREIVMLGAEAVPELLSALSDPDGNVRRGTAWALGQIGDRRAVPFLIELLGDTAGGMFGIGERICDVAAEALERIGTPEALEAIRQWRET